MALGGIDASVVAAPNPPAETSNAAAQNVEWMNADTARTLDIGFAVLVPGSIPAPFSSSPSVSASGGYYQLYWGPSGLTFLQIEGVVGAALPAGSEADLNNQLSINASVRGYDAIHDLTDVYDTVWWIEGGVRYKVSGRGLGIGSLDIANTLVTLVPPDPLPEPTEPPVVEEPEETPDPDPDPEETPDGEESTETPDADSTAEAEATEEADGADAESTAETESEENDDASETEGEAGILSAPATVRSGSSITIQVEGAEASDLLASDGVFPGSGGTGIVDVQDGALAWQAPVVTEPTTVTFSLLVSATGEGVDLIEVTVEPVDPALLDEDSDGTNGPVPPAIGGDGTGGPLDVTLPVGDTP
jgi:hypothetical protein